MADNPTRAAALERARLHIEAVERGLKEDEKYREELRLLAAEKAVLRERIRRYFER